MPTSVKWLMALCIAYSASIFNPASAQPGNDNCSSASPILIPGGGFGTGIFNSANFDLTSATLQAGETFPLAIAQAGQNKKSIWYEFTLPTSRSVRITLTQPSTAIQAGDAGFTVYKTSSCVPSQDSVSIKLTAIPKFGSTFNPCVDPGTYLIQVSGDDAANGLLGIQLSVQDSTGAQYDHPSQAYPFGVLSAFTSYVNFQVQCQSLENAAEVCTSLYQYQQYTKSVWFTFTTPAYFDYMGVLLTSGNAGCTFVNGPPTVGYNLYKGDVTSASYTTLPVVDGCDSMVLSGYSAGERLYRCNELLPNTTYSIQLFFNENFNDNMRLGLAYGGTKPTRAPQPIAANIPAASSLGVITPTVNQQVYYDTDYLACNSRHALDSCGPTLPTKGIPYGTYNYDLSTFFTFTLTAEANIMLYAYSPGNPQPVLTRLFNQAPTNSCTSLTPASILQQGVSTYLYQNCLSPGTYTIQVSGTDSVQPPSSVYCSTLLYNNQTYLYSDLGSQVQVTLYVTKIQDVNHYSLATPGAFDTVHNVAGTMSAMQEGIAYTTHADTLGCGNTVLPAGTHCDTLNRKAIYRELVIGDAYSNGKQDSGILKLSNIGQLNYVLYGGNANTLASAQNAHLYPDSITGLKPYSTCLNYYTANYCYTNDLCVTPGTYTLVAMGDSANVGVTDQPTLTFTVTGTKHYNGVTAQNMGNILDSGASPHLSDVDTFSCINNAVPINGYGPPTETYADSPATKAIYREFYLSAPSAVTFYQHVSYYYVGCGAWANPTMTLFSGQASAGLGGLQPILINGSYTFQGNGSAVISGCNALQPGWYTVVDYGDGPTYAHPFPNTTVPNDIGLSDQLIISVTPACPGPQFDRPYKASVDTNTHKPYLIQWGPRVGSTTAYPLTDTTYTLATENFNCTVDTPFSKQPIVSCNPAMDRVVYYVFTLTQPSFVVINTQGYWGEVFNKDVRLDSAQFPTTTPIQPCIQSTGYIQICQMQPGTYTLVLFADDQEVIGGSCTSVAPTIYIDAPGYSRFDYATNAYDFGTVSPDNTFHNGKTGDVNPFNAGRAPSNDFFYCTTGAAQTDPSDAACAAIYDPRIYYAGVNNHLYDSSLLPQPPDIPRRNLWYTFVVDQPGYVTVEVNNKSLDKTFQYPFSVYQSPVNGSLPFATVVSSGQVDSTVAQGLKFLGDNLEGYYCYAYDSIRFYRPPCGAQAPIRYYVVVDNASAYPQQNQMMPNSQVEVSVKVDSVTAVQPKFDHYYQADTIGLNLASGIDTGATDNFTCASADPNDPFQQTGYGSCAPKTLWYKFTVGVTGYIRYRSNINGIPTSSYGTDIMLFRQTTPGDSTQNGLTYLRNTSTYIDSSNVYWAQQCIAPGTYYLITTGCSMVNQYFQPVIWLNEEAGDFCAKPVVAALSGPGATVATVVVDCHTIGTDYGEFGPTLSCPPNAVTANYKSSWFRIDITGPDTLDVTAYLDENTTATSTDINYRLMTGDCGAMQETSCVQDALTQNTYKCLSQGSYYIQVFTPVAINNIPVTGSIDLHVSAVNHTDTCAPPPGCLANAEFVPQFDCTTDTAVRFVNNSTYGTSVKYKWDFGYKGDTSNDVSPSFTYPALVDSQTYVVKLYLQNTSCGGFDSAIVPVIIPGRPHVNLGPNISTCNADTSITLNATSFNGATYYWQNGLTTPTFTVTSTGQYYVQVTYDNCISVDTVQVFVNNIQHQAPQSDVICPQDSVQLYEYGGYGVTYLWSNQTTSYYTYASQPGLYTVQLFNNGCQIIDSFNVAAADSLQPFPKDTAICFTSTPTFTLNAAVPQVTYYYYYQWQDNSYGPTYSVTAPGTYKVTIQVSGCSVVDSILIHSATPLAPVISGPTVFCAGDSTLLDAGGGYGSYLWSTGDTTRKLSVSSAGSYSVKVGGAGSCPGTSAPVQVASNPAPAPSISGNTSACYLDSVTLTAPTGYATYTWNSGASTPSVRLAARGEAVLSVVDNNGCKGVDSVQLTSSPPALTQTVQSGICGGQTYTMPSGKMVTGAGQYQDTLRSIGGCDSLITSLTLAVFTPVSTDSSASICGGVPFILPSGRTVTSSGTYLDTVKSIGGCDSLLSTVHLTVTTVNTLSVQQSVCSGQPYTLPSGKEVYMAGNYLDTVKSTNGCDSLVTALILGIIVGQNKTTTVSICQGQVYTLPSGKLVTDAGSYQDTVRGKAGCDSLITSLTLVVGQTAAINKTASVCAGQPYTLPSGKLVNAGGQYMDTLRSQGGCDSLVTTVNLSVRASQSFSVSSTLCGGQVYTFPSGKTVSGTGVFQDTLLDGIGCDSLLTSLSLRTITPSLTQSAAAICTNGFYTLLSGRQVSSAGLYLDTVRTSGGCDSLYQTAQVSVITPLFNTVNPVICSNQRYVLPSGKAETEGGSYQDTLHSSGGCDSVITTANLTVMPLTTNQLNASVCSGQAYTLPSGRTVTGAGTYLDTIFYAGGCDSLITSVKLSISYVTNFGINPPQASVCLGDSVLLTAYGGDVYQWNPAGAVASPNSATTLVYPVTNPTVYEVVINNVACNLTDTVRTSVTVNPPPDITVTKSNDVDCIIGTAKLLATGGNEYEWTPSASLTNAHIPNPIALPSASTIYHVQVTTTSGCSGVDSIAVDVTTGGSISNGYAVPSAFTPNHDGINDCFGVQTWGAVTDLKFYIFDRYGTQVFFTNNPGVCWDGTTNGKEMPPAAYVYLITAKTVCGSISRKGTVVLIR